MFANSDCGPTVSDATLSVIIVSYNSMEVIRNCLDSIIAHNDIGKSLEVIVVEQSPDDGIYGLLKSEYPMFRIIRNKNNGFGAGNNAGFRVSRGKYLLFLNPDTVLIEPVFSFAVSKFEDSKKLGLLGVRLLNEDGRRTRSFYFRNPCGFWAACLWAMMDKVDWFWPGKMYISGADMFMTREAFEAIGGFDEVFFMYREEADVCNRLDQLGYGISYYPEKRILHLEGRSTSSESVTRIKLDSLRHYSSKYSLDYARFLKQWRRSLKVYLLFRPNDEIKKSRVALLEEELNNNLSKGKKR